MRNHNTTPQPQQQEILTAGDYLRSKVNSVVSRGIGRIATMKDGIVGGIKVDRHLVRTTYSDEDSPISQELKDQNDAYLSYRDNLVASYVIDKPEIRKETREYRKAKTKYILRRIGSAAMWVPGLDVIGDAITVAHTSRQINKKLKREYLRKNGGGFFRQIQSIHEGNKQKFSKQKAVLDDFSELTNSRRDQWKEL